MSNVPAGKRRTHSEAGTLSDGLIAKH